MNVATCNEIIQTGNLERAHNVLDILEENYDNLTSEEHETYIRLQTFIDELEGEVNTYDLVDVPIVQPSRPGPTLPSFAELKKMQKQVPTPKEEEVQKDPIPSEPKSIYPTIEVKPEDMVERNGRMVKKKVRISQKKPKEAHTLEGFKMTLGYQVKTPIFYRYIRIPDKRKENWEGPNKEVALLFNSSDYGSTKRDFMFSFSMCNSEDNFSKDRARKLCQERYIKGEYVRVANCDLESSHIENIRRALFNLFNNRNLHTTEPIISLLPNSIKNDSLKQLLKAAEYKLRETM